MRKGLKVLLGLLIFTSCCNCDTEKYNPSGYNPATMDERELYLTYGLEAPDEFYNSLLNKMESSGFGSDTYCNQVEKESPLSTLFRVSIQVDSLRISNAMIYRSDFSNKLNNEIERILNSMTWHYDMENRQSGDVTFRLDLKKLCRIKK